jgi:hypothetical protein
MWFDSDFHNRGVFSVFPVSESHRRAGNGIQRFAGFDVFIRLVY